MPNAIPLPRLFLLLFVSAVLGGSAPLGADEKPGFRWENDAEAGTADLYFGEEPVVRYMYAYDPSTPERQHETYKTYHHVFGPGTGAKITKGPGGLYTHHRGLYVGWNKTQFNGQSLDFWHCRKGEHLKHEKFLEMQAGADHGTMTAEIHWNDAEGEPVIVERRTVTVRAIRPEGASGHAWQIDWQTVLESRRGEIRLDGDRQHAGFQYRAHNDVADSNGARFIRPENFPQQPEAVQVGDAGDPPAHIDLGWFAMTYERDGQRYTVEYMEHPALPKPSLFSERPYGRFGAFWKATLTPEEPLAMHYRVVVSSGPAPDSGAIQARYDAFVKEGVTSQD